MAIFLHCGSLEKWIFEKLLETAQAILFVMLSVSVAYSASVRCVALFVLCESQQKSNFQELLETPQTIFCTF